MKKFLFCFLAMGSFSLAAHAQDTFEATEYDIPMANPIHCKSTTDTLRPPSSNLSCYSFYTYENASGYITGANTSGDTMYAQIYKNTGNKVCSGLIVLVVVKSGEGNFTGKLYSVKNNAPDTVIETSLSLSSKDMPGVFGFIALPFDSPVPVSTDFAAVAGFSSQNINCGILSTNDNCVATGYENLSYAGSSTGQWTTIKDKYGLNIDLHIYAVLNENTMNIKENPLTLNASVYPNPAYSSVTIVSLDKIEKFQVFNMTGQLIYEDNPHELIAQLDVNTWINGNYVIKLHTIKGSISKKLTIFR